MHGTAIFQVTDHCDVEIVQTPLSFLNREQIQQGLRRMLVGTITGIQYRYIAGKLGGQACRTFLRVAHHNRIDIGTNNRNGIGQRFPFFTQ